MPVYLSLERLEESWTEKLENLAAFSFDEKVFAETEFQIPLEQLAAYFLFRHLGDSFFDGTILQRVRFSLMSCYMIGALWEYTNSTKIEDMADLARQYSAEIEYSEENMDALLYLEETEK